LPVDGASSDSATLDCSWRYGCLPSRNSTLRSPRPGVSPPCPEHGGLASSPIGRGLTATKLAIAGTKAHA